MAQSLPDLFAAARQMLAALNANAAAVATRGIDVGFIQNGQSFVDTAQQFETEQETLKAALKAKTAQLEAATAQLKDWQSEASGAVKLAYRTQPEKWGEFGLKARK
jgi:hypothetical protein